MKKRHVALAVGLAITMGACSMGLAACDNPDTPAEPSPFEDDAMFETVPVTETTHFLAGKFAEYGDQWSPAGDKPVNDALRFKQHTENETLYKISIALYEGDQFKIRYEGVGWGSGTHKGSIPADYLIDKQKNDEKGDIIGNGGMGGKNFEVKKDGTYEIWLTMNAEQDMPVSVQYVRKGDAPKLSVSVTGVTLNTTRTTIEEGATKKLTATVLPSNADDDKKVVIWTSSDEEVATVDQTGLVTAVAVGTCTITATADGKSATCDVTVVEEGAAIPVETIALKGENGAGLTQKSGMHAGESFTVEATVFPSDASITEVTWSVVLKEEGTPTDNVTITEDAENPNKITVKCVKPGDYIVKATADEVTAEIEVNVETDYYLVGSTKNPALGEWQTLDNFADVPEALRFVKQADGTYKASGINLYANDAVKVIIVGLGWSGSQETDEFNESDLETATEETGNGDIVISEDGKYDIILSIADHKIKFEKVGEADALEVVQFSYEYVYAYGTMNGWTREKLNNEDLDNEHSELTFDLTLEKDDEFLFILNNGEDKWIKAPNLATPESVELQGLLTDKGDGNILCTAAGTYNITISVNDYGDVSIIINSFTAASVDAGEDEAE